MAAFRRMRRGRLRRAGRLSVSARGRRRTWGHRATCCTLRESIENGTAAAVGATASANAAPGTTSFIVVRFGSDGVRRHGSDRLFGMAGEDADGSHVSDRARSAGRPSACRPHRRTGRSTEASGLATGIGSSHLAAMGEGRRPRRGSCAGPTGSSGRRGRNSPSRSSTAQRDHDRAHRRSPRCPRGRAVPWIKAGHPSADASERPVDISRAPGAEGECRAAARSRRTGRRAAGRVRARPCREPGLCSARKAWRELRPEGFEVARWSTGSITAACPSRSGTCPPPRADRHAARRRRPPKRRRERRTKSPARARRFDCAHPREDRPPRGSRTTRPGTQDAVGATVTASGPSQWAPNLPRKAGRGRGWAAPLL
jgi:hypothetical protein